jgi:transposase-like protein
MSVGGSKPGAKGGRSTEHKSLVIGAVEVEASKRAPGGRRAKRVRLGVIPTASGAELTKFVRDHVVPGTIVYTDGWEGYSGLRKLGYDHKPTVEVAPERASKILPVIHREFANLKTWLQGTHHGRVERQPLQAYLNETSSRSATTGGSGSSRHSSVRSRSA